MLVLLKTLIFSYLLFDQAIGGSLQLINESSTSFVIQYVIGNGHIHPQPNHLDQERLSLELTPNNMPLRATIRLQPYDINIALFDDRLQITNCDYSPIICNVTAHQIIFTNRTSLPSLNTQANKR